MRWIAAICVVTFLAASCGDDADVADEADDVAAVADGDSDEVGEVDDTTSTTSPGGAGFVTSVVATVESNAQYLGVVVPPDGRPVAALYDMRFTEPGAQASLEGSLRLVRCDDISCASASEVRRDAPGMNWGLSMTLGTDGLPVIAYSQLLEESESGETTGTASVITCADPACGELTEATIDDAQSASVAVAADGTIHVATTRMFPDPASSEPGFPIHICTESPCVDWLQVVDVDGPQFATGPEIAVGPDGLPVAVLGGQNPLSVFECLDPACATTEETVLGGTADFPSVAAAENGPSAVLYDEGSGPVLVTWDDAPSNATRITLDHGGISGPPPALAVAPDGLPVVAWMSRTAGAEPRETELKVARCDDRTCESGTTATVVKALAGWGSAAGVALAVDPDGNPVVVFIDEQTDPATVVLGRCSDPGCTDGALAVQTWGTD